MTSVQNVPADPSAPQALSATGHPWRRFFARGVDFSFYAFLWYMAQALFLRWLPTGALAATLVLTYVPIALMLVLEPLFLSTLGTTPGKAVFGLRLRCADGAKLSYGAAFRRAFSVFVRGYGCNLPVLDVVCEYRCMRASDKGKMSPWNVGLDYQLADTRPWRIFGYVLVSCVLLLLSGWAELLYDFPPHRAPLTSAQYVENVNAMSRRSRTYYNLRIDEDGRWYRADARAVDALFFSQDNPAGQEWTVENGVLTGVRFQFVSQENYISDPGALQKSYITHAFFGAQRQVDCITLNFSKDLKNVLRSTEDLDFVLCGVRITQRVEQKSGYEYRDGDYTAQEGVPHRFSMSFAMELVD